MPSLIAWVTPCRKPSSRARSMSSPVARERWAMAPRICRRAASLKVWAPAGLGGELRHLLDAGLVGLAALEMGALQEASLLSAVVACAGKGVEEMGMVLLSF